LSSLQLADEDLDSSLWVLGSYQYHMEDRGPLGLTEAGHSAPSGPSELREGPERQRADEERLRSGGPALKCHWPMALR
jgi:hypothetical protein